jgi:hypothetical protein
MRSFVFYVVTLIAVTAQAQPSAPLSVAEMRRRGEYRQAEQFGLEQWRRDTFPDRERAELAIQLALVYTEQALSSPRESADSLWNKAQDICQQFTAGWPENPRGILVEVQRALVSLARGTQAREQWRDMVQAVEHLRTALRQLGELSDRTSRALIEQRLRGRTKQSPDLLTIDELESLEVNLAFHLARAQRQLGLCYAPRSADRDDALLQAVQRLAPLAARTPANELVWNARLELIECYRELGKSVAARKSAEDWLRENPPAEVAKRLTVNPTISEPYLEQYLPKRHHDDFEKALAAANRERSAGRFAPAAEQYRQLALQQPNHPRAAEAHRMAILQVAEILRASDSTEKAAFAATYEELLREHLAQWANQSSADDVRLWLGRLLVTRREWQRAIDVLQQVRPETTAYSASVKLIIECYENQLRDWAESLEKSDASTHRNRLLSAATQQLQPIITGPNNQWPAEWNDLQRDVALALARLHLRYTEEPSPYAEKLLIAALRGATNIDSANRTSWRGTARCQLLIALVRNGKVEDVHPLLDEAILSASADVLLELLADLDRQMAVAMSSAQKDPHVAGQVALKIARHLDAHRTDLATDALPRLAMYRATALATTGERAAAHAQMGALATEWPNNADIQERYAMLLATSDSPEELRQAVGQWQKVEGGSRSGSPRWRRARQARIELLTRLGDTADAEKLLRLTRLLHPDWDTATVPSQ